LPGKEETDKFEKIIEQIKSFDITKSFEQNPAKCAQCIYRELCV